MALVEKPKSEQTGYGTKLGGPTLGTLLEDGNDMIPLTLGGVLVIDGANAIDEPVVLEEASVVP